MNSRILVSLWELDGSPLDHLKDLDVVMSISGKWNSSFLTMFLLIPVHLGGCWGVAANGVHSPEDLKINYMLTCGFSPYL